MNISIKTNTDPKVAAEFIAQSIKYQLENNKKVLWFVTGGSSITVASEVSKILINTPHQNLTVMLTDERYGPIDYPESNWNQLIKKGFVLPDAHLIPILTGDNRNDTTKKFITHLEQELAKADFKIGLFGIGADGHTGGMLPHTEGVHSPDLAFDYSAINFERITVTPKTIRQLNEVVVFMQGQEKWPVIGKLQAGTTTVEEIPAQTLKEVGLFTIFTDYQKV